MKQSIYLFSLLSLLLFMGGCNDEEDVFTPFFSDGVKENIREELVDVSACVYDQEKDVAFVCYSQYADSYYEAYLKDKNCLDSFSEEMKNDILSHLVGVALKEIKDAEIEIPSKVIISALVTDNNVLFGKEFDSAGLYQPIYKAYLQDVKQRN